jgi:hypothetical protein
MNHNVTLAIVAIVAATALTAVPLAIPQQALAGGYHNNHNNHNKHNNHNSHNSNSIKVDQQVNQANFCNGTSSTPDNGAQNTAVLPGGSGSSTVCLNFGDNSADIHK